MNTGLIVMSCLAILAMTLHAQESSGTKQVPKFRLERAKKNIAAGMRSTNDGLMEASFVLAAKMKMKYPEESIAELKSILDSISVAHDSEVIRYKAYLSSYICGDPDWFAMDSAVASADVEHFFPAAARRLQQKIFGMNNP
ncbi:MAG: hypothetical protein AB1728_07780 [Bacteroidota bacterium]